MRPLLLLMVVLGAACAGDDAPKDAVVGDADRNQPADTMALLMPDGAEVWLTGSMRDTSATGEPCEARSVEIRRASRRTPVPLLYTLGGLEPVDDTMVRADLVRNCAKYDTYLVNTRTGQPRRAE